ncbi:MAG: acyl carrier protein [Deltaproteobacteria bacterium]|nr:acyl carrier protein [Deltaproteobacteria bacterium]
MEDKVFEQVIELVGPFAKNKPALEKAAETSSFLKDLQVSSSRLVDIVLAIEDKFGIEVGDDEADKISTVGSAVALIRSKQACNA